MERFRREDVRDCESWPEWRKVKTTRARRIDGPFEVETREGKLSCQDGWLAVDSGGFPYPIDNEEFETIYEALPKVPDGE